MDGEHGAVSTVSQCRHGRKTPVVGVCIFDADDFRLNG